MPLPTSPCIWSTSPTSIGRGSRLPNACRACCPICPRRSAAALPRFPHRFRTFTCSQSRDRSRFSKSVNRSEEHTSELQSLMRISYAVFCLKKKNNKNMWIHHQLMNHYTDTKYKHSSVDE